MVIQTQNMGKSSISQISDAAKETKSMASAGSLPSTPQKVGISTGAKITTANSAISSNASTLKRNSSRSHSTVNIQTKTDVVPIIIPRTSSRVEPADSRKDASDVVPVIVPRTNSKVNMASDYRKEIGDVVPVVVPRTSSRIELASDSRKELVAGRTLPHSVQSKFSDFRKSSSIKDDPDRADMGSRITESNEVTNQNYSSFRNGVSQTMDTGEDYISDVKDPGARKLGSSYRHENYNTRVHKPRNASSVEVSRGGRTRSLVASWESKEESSSYEEDKPSTSSVMMATTSMSYSSRERTPYGQKEVYASDVDAVADIIEQHELFLSVARSRLTKLQVVHQLWRRNDIKGVLNAVEKMSDNTVSADVISVLMEKSDTITLELCTCLLPLLTSLLESKMDRHLDISLEMLLKLVRIFGPVIHSTLSAGPSVGVDLQAEQRQERCNLCFIELEKVKHTLSSTTRRKGSIGKSAQELNLALQEVL